MTAHFNVDRTQYMPIPTRRRERGKCACLSGESAEKQVKKHYEANGATLLAHRWRGRSGEIDLIFQHGETIVFVEVKKATTIDQAIDRLKRAQAQRIYATASEYLEFTPQGQLSDVRFDLAAVDGAGRIDVIENAFGHF